MTFIGLTCRGGFIRGIRGTIVGREFEDIRDRIENDFESWEIALIVSGSFAASVLVALIMYVVLVCRQGQSETFEEYPLQGIHSFIPSSSILLYRDGFCRILSSLVYFGNAKFWFIFLIIFV